MLPLRRATLVVMNDERDAYCMAQEDLLTLNPNIFWTLISQVIHMEFFADVPHVGI
jgi:hypothetical protein